LLKNTASHKFLEANAGMKDGSMGEVWEKSVLEGLNERDSSIEPGEMKSLRFIGNTSTMESTGQLFTYKPTRELKNRTQP
jgi:hypothetical protein